MSIDMNLLSVNADALSTNQNSELPGWNVPSHMAFHIVFDGRLDINGKLDPVIRRPYRDTSRPYNQRRDFMAHETRQVLDDRMPAGVEYGIVTFDGGSKAAREERAGWSSISLAVGPTTASAFAAFTVTRRTRDSCSSLMRKAVSTARTIWGYISPATQRRPSACADSSPRIP